MAYFIMSKFSARSFWKMGQDKEAIERDGR